MLPLTNDGKRVIAYSDRLYYHFTELIILLRHHGKLRQFQLSEMKEDCRIYS